MLKLQRVNHVVQREVELALLLERLDDRQVVHAAVLDADDLIADAVAQQVDGEVAGLEGEPAVVGGRRAAALGVAETALSWILSLKMVTPLRTVTILP